MTAILDAPEIDSPPSTGLSPREQADALIATLAYNSNDVVSCYDGFRYFVSDAPAGAVAYVQRGGMWVANGDPLCRTEDMADVLRRFVAAARSQRKGVAFLGASERAKRVAAELGFGAFKVGEEPVFDLTTYAPRGDKAKKARAARNQATKGGVTVQEYRPQERRDGAIEREMETVLAAWQATRPVDGLAFSLRVEPFANLERKRYFVARQEGRIIAFLAASLLRGRAGAYLEDVIRHPDAPYGSTELLVLTALEELAQAGVRSATLGVAPLQGVEVQANRRLRALGRTVAAMRDRADRVYHFNSLNHYKRKFGPTGYEASYLLYRPARITPRLLLGLLGAFTPDGLGPFLRERLTPRRPVRRRSVRRIDAPSTWMSALAIVGLLASVIALHLRYPGPLPDLHLLRLRPLVFVPAVAGAGVMARAHMRRR